MQECFISWNFPLKNGKVLLTAVAASAPNMDLESSSKIPIRTQRHSCHDCKPLKGRTKKSVQRKLCDRNYQLLNRKNPTLCCWVASHLDFYHSRFSLEYTMKFVLFHVHWDQAKAFCEDVSAILLLEIVAFTLMQSYNNNTLVHPCFDVLLM